MSESRRLIDLLIATDEFFKAKGIESPRRNAEALFSVALAVPRLELYLQYDRPLKDAELAALRELIRRRAKREPLQYIEGEVEFCGARIVLRNGLLVPRPETEELVSKLLKLLPPAATVLDIGCGTGCIAVGLAKNDGTLQLTAVDKDADALDVTRRNAERNGIGGSVQVRGADLFDAEFCAACGGPFDVVVSNPPYIREDEWASLQPEVKDFERKHALVSGPKGTECYVRIAELLPKLLKSGGRLVLELGQGQAESVREIFSAELGELVILRDLHGIERFLIGRRK